MDDSKYPDGTIVRDFRARYLAGPAPSPAAMRRFRAIIRGYYRSHGRDLPWRRTGDPFHILVSEIMLQQTQVGRVAEKFPAFIAAFPAAKDLAAATLREVMAAWQGMGYNRRARHLRELARVLVAEHGGRVPDDEAALASLPGIGPATAASIRAFAFNRPAVFIETNIRAVFIHFFFPGGSKVADRDIIPLVASALDRRNPRRWYSALMDYGSMLKRRHPNPSRASDRHRRQAPFVGSRRQLRGAILRALVTRPGVTVRRLAALAGRPEKEVARAMDDLVREGLVMVKKKKVFLNDG